MPNHDKSTGTAGTLRISDNGSTVSFIILCSDGATNVGSLSWSGVVNGQNVGGNVSLSAGFGARTVGTWNVSTAQTVQFNIGASGTQGLGGPTNHSAAISRGSAPGAPGAPVVTELTSTSAKFTWTAASGSSPNYGLYISEDPAFGSHVYAEWLGNVLTKTVDVLKPGKKYYARVRAQNGTGVGPYSPSTPLTTPSGVYQSNGSAWTQLPVNVSDGSVWQQGAIVSSDGSAWKPVA